MRSGVPKSCRPMPPKQHSEHGASKAYRWIACPGSVAMERGLPDQSSEHAREGTLAHEVAECLLRGQHLDTLGDVSVTEEMLEAVQVYVDTVTKIHAAAGPNAQRFIEQEFNLAPLNPPVPMYGTSDCCIWDPDTKHLHVIDYKHGRGVLVEVERNPQLMYYALGAVVALKVRPVAVTITVVQPRAEHPDGPIRSWTFDWQTLVDYKRELFAAAERTLAPDAPLVPGPHCKFCKAQAICPAQQKLAEEVAQSEFAVVQANPTALPTPEALTLDQLTRALDVADTIENWFRSVRAHVQFLLELGHEVPGYKLVKRRANRKWRDEAAAAAWLEQHLGEDAYEEPKLRSPAQAEKRLKKIDKAAAKEMEQFVTKESSGVVLAPDTDKRPAVVAGVDEFTALPSGD